MRSDISNASQRCTQLEQATNNLQQALNSTLKPLANSALQGIETLGNSIVTLYQMTQDLSKTIADSEEQVATCKGQSQIVAQRFNTLHNKAAGVLQSAGNVRHMVLGLGEKVY